MLSSFDTIPQCDGRTDGQTDRIPISISRVGVAVRAIIIAACSTAIFVCFLFIFGYKRKSEI